MKRSTAIAIFAAAGLGTLFAAEQGGAPASSDAPALTFYVSPSGDDSSNGLQPDAKQGVKDGPKKTLKGILDEIKARKDAKSLKGPVKVLLKGGRYFVSEPLTISPESFWPASFESMPGEEAVLDGGVKIASWSKGKLNGSDVWSADVSSILKEKGSFRQLFVNGRRVEMARVPSKGVYYAEIGWAKTALKPVERLGSVDFGFKDAEKEGLEVVIANKWTMYRVPMKDLKPQSGQELQPPKLHDGSKVKDPAYYWVENVLTALREPGTWAMDYKGGRLYYLPLPGEAPESSECFVSCATQLLQAKGDWAKGAFLDGLSFRNMAFEHTGRLESVSKYFGQAASGVPGALILEGVKNFYFEGCRFERLGGYAIQLKQGCSKGKISFCSFVDLGAGGVIAGGSDARQPVEGRTGDVAISDCVFKDGGKIFLDACAVLLMHSGGNQVVHNLIRDYGYTGVSAGWSWGHADSVSRDNLIAKNHIFNIGMGKLLSDMGAIYTLGVSPGTRICGNLIHDVDMGDYCGNGIYLDEGSSFMTVESNVCYNVSSYAYFQHYGRDNLVVNNVFAFGRECVAALHQGRKKDQGYPFAKFSNPRSVFFYRNILLSDGTAIYQGGGNAKLEAKDIFGDLNTVWNLSGKDVFNGKPEKPMSWADWKALGEDFNSQAVDPKFKDPKGGDFSLPADSPAFKLGFLPIDLSDVGPRPRGFVEKNDDGSPVAKQDLSHPLLKELIKVKRLPQPPASQGTLQDSDWPASFASLELTQTPDRKAAQAPAAARLAYDSNCLYVSVSIPLKGQPVKGMEWGQSDGAEVCLRDASTEKPGQTFVLHGYSSGRLEAVADAGASQSASAKLKTSSSFSATASDGSWTASWALPFAALGVKPSPGLKLGFNIGVHRSEGDEWVNLMGTLGPTWDLDGARRIELE